MESKRSGESLLAHDRSVADIELSQACKRSLPFRKYEMFVKPPSQNPTPKRPTFEIMIARP